MENGTFLSLFLSRHQKKMCNECRKLCNNRCRVLEDKLVALRLEIVAVKELLNKVPQPQPQSTPGTTYMRQVPPNLVTIAENETVWVDAKSFNEACAKLEDAREKNEALRAVANAAAVRSCSNCNGHPHYPPSSHYNDVLSYIMVNEESWVSGKAWNALLTASKKLKEKYEGENSSYLSHTSSGRTFDQVAESTWVAGALWNSLVVAYTGYKHSCEAWKDDYDAVRARAVRAEETVARLQGEQPYEIQKLKKELEETKKIDNAALDAQNAELKRTITELNDLRNFVVKKNEQITALSSKLHKLKKALADSDSDSDSDSEVQ